MRANVCVVGGGVIGLSTALLLRRQGYRVVVRDCRPADPTRPRPGEYPATSDVAAAFWYPFAINVGEEVERLLALPTFNFLLEVERDPTAGVFLGDAEQYFDTDAPKGKDVPPGLGKPLGPPVPWWAKLHSLAGHVKFSHLTSSELPSNTVETEPELGQIVHGWKFRVPLVHPLTFQTWLRGQLAAGGVMVERVEVTQLADLRDEFDAVVNCTGGWASRLVESRPLFALQGVVLRVPWVENLKWRDDKAPMPHLVFLEHGRCEDAPVYIVRHRPADGRDAPPTILGGTVTRVTRPGDKWPVGGELWRPSHSDVMAVLHRCGLIAPHFATGYDGYAAPTTPDGGYGAVAGLRPCQEECPPRIEYDRDLSKDGKFAVVHNYGHGGSGYTMFWGSALEVHRLLTQHGVHP